jgi:hypothetical protein
MLQIRLLLRVRLLPKNVFHGVRRHLRRLLLPRMLVRLVRLLLKALPRALACFRVPLSILPLRPRRGAASCESWRR